VSLWRRILQGMVAFSADTVISNLAAVLSAALVFRYLDVSAYGQLTLALSFCTGATVFLDFGLNTVFTAEIARARGGGNLGWAKFLLIRYLWLRTLMGCVVLIVFLAIGHQRREPLWTVMGVYLLTTALNGVATTLFHSYTHYRCLAAQSIVQSLSRLMLLATLPLWWQGDTLVAVAWTYPLMDVVALLVSAWLARTVLRDLRDFRADRYSLTSLTVLLRQQGVYATLSIPVKRVADQLPIWFLKVLGGDIGVGIYGAAHKGFSLIYAFFSALEITIFPLISEQIEVDKERLQIALRQIQKYTFWLGLVVAVVGGLAAHWLILIVAGEEYLAAVPVFRLMLWQLVIYAFWQSQRPLFYALGQQRWLFVLYLFNTMIYALVLFCAITATGILGAVWATLFHAVLFTITRMIVLQKLGQWVLVDPRSVFKIEGFDRRLWEILRMWVLRRLGSGGVVGVVGKLYRRLQFLMSIPKKDFLCIPKIKLILTVKPYTKLSYARLSKLYEAASHLEKEGIDGSFVECGVWNGGSAGIIAAVAKHNRNRHIWLFDSWEGLPEPSESDIDYKGRQGEKGMALGSEEKVKELFYRKLRLHNKVNHLVKGWFSDTLPAHKNDVGEIALLHLDCDWYESTKLCLEELYDMVVVGGSIFIDDYGHWGGCKKAVDEFIEKRNLRIELVKIDYTGVCFRKGNDCRSGI